MPFPGGDTFLTGVPLGSRSATQGKSATKPPPQRSSSGGMFNLVMVPFVIFTSISLLFAFLYHYEDTFVWVGVAVGAAMGILCLYLHTKNPLGPHYMFLGVLSLIAVGVATPLGYYNYHEFLMNYYGHSALVTYTNVLPTEPAAAHSDAGEIVFSQEARVDTTKGLGFKATNLYCVAPILDDTQATRVEYWAAGLDCCSQRADFACDSSWDPKARSGFVILDNNSLFKSSYEHYMMAVQEAQAAYGLTAGKKTILVRWVSDPQAMEDEYWKYGMYFLLISVGAYFVISLLLGLLLHMNSSSKPGR